MKSQTLLLVAFAAFFSLAAANNRLLYTTGIAAPAVAAVPMGGVYGVGYGLGGVAAPVMGGVGYGVGYGLGGLGYGVGYGVGGVGTVGYGVEYGVGGLGVGGVVSTAPYNTVR
eukprot:TRINITY_DN6282_c0_g1_i2.p1 TRINITY_DN6282_c0_g1~~TRINITY_DN6282_c0_g1_i2.p1  ORF type:complete len:113 (-),score=24.34 TRINITY_DN6282_c0_g1_i2:182-520(-)